MTLRHRITLFSLIFVTASMLSPAAWAQDIEPSQRYLLLATERISTLQKELDTAAGFRVRMRTSTSNEILIFMERGAEPPNTYTYLRLDTRRTDTLQKEVNEAGARGYRLLPRTMMTGVCCESVAIVELAPGETRRYEYKWLAAPPRTTKIPLRDLVVLGPRTFQTEVTELVEAGFIIAGLTGQTRWNMGMVIMERQSQ